jgi:adenosylcobinamide-GDP ribazoletransferase
MKPITAAFIFFTRLPLWRLKTFNVAPGYFRDAINYWAVTGWLTAGVMAGTLWLAAQALPYMVAVVLAILSRILLTGALHEDGLADFLDGFGGGPNRDKTLSIMKDSHIGAYGVIGLIFYFLLFFLLFSNLPLSTACVIMLIADPLCKLISSQVVRFLPYARTEESSKAKVIYSKPTPVAFLISCLFGLLPLAVLIPDIKWLFALLSPLLAFIFLIRLMKRKINGYTGDCCGALFLLCELSFYIGIIICTKYFLV